MTSAPDLVGRLAVSVQPTGERVVLGVRGELDHSSAPELGVVLDTVIGRRYRSVVVDLDHCDFIGSSGLQAIGDGATRLALLGGTLTIRAPSAMVRRLLAIMELDELVRIEQLGPPPGRLGPGGAGAPNG